MKTLLCLMGMWARSARRLHEQGLALVDVFNHCSVLCDICVAGVRKRSASLHGTANPSHFVDSNTRGLEEPQQAAADLSALACSRAWKPNSEQQTARCADATLEDEDSDDVSWFFEDAHLSAPLGQGDYQIKSAESRTSPWDSDVPHDVSRQPDPLCADPVVVTLVSTLDTAHDLPLGTGTSPHQSLNSHATCLATTTAPRSTTLPEPRTLAAKVLSHSRHFGGSCRNSADRSDDDTMSQSCATPSSSPYQRVRCISSSDAVYACGNRLKATPVAMPATTAGSPAAFSIAAASSDTAAPCYDVQSDADVAVTFRPGSVSGFDAGSISAAPSPLAAHARISDARPCSAALPSLPAGRTIRTGSCALSASCDIAGSSAVPKQCDAPGSWSRMSLVRALCRGSAPSVQSLATDVVLAAALASSHFGAAVASEAALLPQLRVEDVSSCVVVGPAVDCCAVVPGGLIVSGVPADVVLSLGWRRGTVQHRALLLQGDLTPSYKHLGYRESVRVRHTVKQLPEQTRAERWLAEMKAAVQELGVTLLLVKGRAHDSVRAWCHRLPPNDAPADELCTPLLLEGVPFRVLKSLSACEPKASILNYIFDADEDDVIGGLLLEPWADHGPSLFVRAGSVAIDSGQGGGIVKITPTRQLNVVISVIICHPVAAAAKALEEQLWHCLRRIASCARENTVLPSGIADNHLCHAVDELKGWLASASNRAADLSDESVRRIACAEALISNVELLLVKLRGAAVASEECCCPMDDLVSVAEAWRLSLSAVHLAMTCDSFIKLGTMQLSADDVSVRGDTLKVGVL